MTFIILNEYFLRIYPTMKTNVEFKFSELSSILSSELKGIHLARIKLIVNIILALCKVQTVTFEKLALAFDSEVKPESSLRRIQRFMAEYNLNPDLVAKLIFNLLPSKDKLILSIDRTNWKFGQTDINIFMLGIVYKGVAFPLLFSMLAKKGNSNTIERIKLIDRFINLFGKDCIDCLVADREFVGEKWFEYLNFEAIDYHIRIRNNFIITNPRTRKKYKAFWLFNHLKIGEFIQYDKIVKINNQLCYLSGSKLKNGEFIILVSYINPKQAKEKYKHRWQIETCFKAMKSSGFDIENTHLSDIQRIEKLVLLVMIALVWCYKIGIYVHENIKKIQIKKHGRKAQSIFKCGLKWVANVLLNTQNQDDINIASFLSCT